MQSTVPLMMHGDAVPTVGCAKVWAKLMQCFSWSGLLSTGSTKERSFFLWGATPCKYGTMFGQIVICISLFILCGDRLWEEYLVNQIVLALGLYFLPYGVGALVLKAFFAFFKRLKPLHKHVSSGL